MFNAELRGRSFPAGGGLLREGKANEALKDARAAGCETPLWVRLAGALEKVQLRRRSGSTGKQVAPIVARTHNAAYEEASGLVRRIRNLLANVGNGAACGDIVDRLRRVHRAKRNFVALLDALSREDPQDRPPEAGGSDRCRSIGK